MIVDGYVNDGDARWILISLRHRECVRATLQSTPIRYGIPAILSSATTYKADITYPVISSVFVETFTISK